VPCGELSSFGLTDSRIPIYRCSTMSPDCESRRPLSPVVLRILLALSDQPRHGYGIMKEVEMVSGRKFRFGPGTLYDNLSQANG
jgi:hypothetical protein